MDRDKYKHRLILFGEISILWVVLGMWLFGWGGGNINIIDVEAKDVSQIELLRTTFGSKKITITEGEDIQTVIDNVNSFRYSGNELKYLLQGKAFGSTFLYYITVYPKEGDVIELVLSALGGYGLSETEMSYWFPADPNFFISNTCEGPMTWYDDLYAKYSIS